jgi:hypothetical protein
MLAFVLLLSASSDETPIPTIAPVPTTAKTPSPASLPTFTGEVIDLDGLPKPNGTAYLVFFYSEKCDQCVEFGRAWEKVAEVGAGLIAWAALNCDKYPRDCQYHAVVKEEPSFYMIEGDGSGKQLPSQQDIRDLLDLLCSRVPDQYVFVDRYNYTVNADENGAFFFADGKSVTKLWTAVQNLLNRKDIVFYASTDRGLYDDLGLTKVPGIYAIRKGEFIPFGAAIAPRQIANFIAEIFPLDTAAGPTTVEFDTGL